MAHLPDPITGALIVSCQQTRFYISETSSNEIDIKGVNVTIASDGHDPNGASGSKIKGKSKAKREGLEIFIDAHLKLREGVRYALVGRNGSGKSILLRTIAQKLIPGIPLSLRIAALRQTSDGEDEPSPAGDDQKSVLDQVVHGDPYRNTIVQELDLISKALEASNDLFAPVRALRRIRHDRLEAEFFQVQKQASLRSGTRGYDARKVLIAFEKKIEDSLALLNQDDVDLDKDIVTKDTREAVALQSDLVSILETMTQADTEARARQVLSGLDFRDSQLGIPFAKLSGGWKMRCQLAAALTQNADILILDEPTNFLDLCGILWLQRYIENLQTTRPEVTVLLVSHDRDFVNAVCSDIILIRDRSLTYFNGNIAAHDKYTRHEMLRLGRMKAAQEQETAHLEKTIAQSMRQAKKTGDENKVRQAKSRQKKLDDRIGHNVNAQGHRFKLNRDLAGYYTQGRVDVVVPEAERGVTILFPDPPPLRFPGALMTMEDVGFRYPQASKSTLQKLRLVVHLGDRVGILGLNGAGKSTLVQLMVGALQPTSGAISRHPRLRLGYYAQHAVDELHSMGQREPKLTALATILQDDKAQSSGHASLAEDVERKELTEQEARSLLAGLGLDSQAASHTPMRGLSGGQLARLALARILRTRPHILVLDEPSTHLDLPSVTGLARGLKEFAGAVVLVTHDRFLVRSVVEGESVDDKDSSDEDEDEAADGNEEVSRRRLVFEVRSGTMVEKTKGVTGWEDSLSGRLKRLGL